jgi:hypothetical protein
VERIFGARGVVASGGAGGYSISYTRCRTHGAQAEVGYETAVVRGHIKTWAFNKWWRADAASPSAVSVKEYFAVAERTNGSISWSPPYDSGHIADGPTKHWVEKWFDVRGLRTEGGDYYYPTARRSEWNHDLGKKHKYWALFCRYSSQGRLTRMQAVPSRTPWE